MRLGRFILIGCLVFIGTMGAVFAQAPHGLNWSWAPVTLDVNGNPANITGYNIYCATAATGPFSTKTNSALLATPAYLETGLTAGQTSFCQVTAVNAVGEGGHSATGSALFQPPPAVPVTPGAPAAISQ